MKRLLLLFSYLLLNFNSFSQITIAQWNFDASTAVPTTTAANTTVTNVVYGSGITGTPAYFGGNPSTGKAISNTGWNVTAIDLTKYLEVSITPSAGFSFNLTNFKFDGLRSSSGATNWAVRSSVDNFSTDIMIGTTGTSFSTNTISLTSSSYQNLSNIVKVRIYGYGATASTGTFRVDNITFSGSINSSSPTLTANPTTLSNLNYFSGNGPSTANSFNLTGSSLTPTADNITVTAPTNFEVSTTSNTTGFADNLTIAYTGGNLASTTVFARLKAGLADNSYTGNVTFAGGGVLTTPTVALSGTVSPPSPTITLSPISITGMTYVVGTGPSTGSAYSVSGTYLSPASGNISVVAPTNFELSTSLAGTYADNLTIPYTGGALSANTLYVRLKAGLTQNSYSGNIGHTGGGVVTSTNVAVSGVVTNTGTGPCGTSTAIGTAKLGADATVVTIQGRLSVDTEFGPNLIYIQDGNGVAGTGGIEIYFSSGNAALGASINAGDEVQVTGTMTTYNGNREILNPTCFVKTSAPNQAVTPFVITLAEVSMHEGELVKFVNTTIGDEVPVPTAATTKFLGSKNYSFSTTSPTASGELRIDANTLLSNTTRPTTITSVVGIINHYVTTGTGAVNKYQIYPRDVDDIPGTTGGGGGAGACTTLGFSNVPVAQTLEVTAWNVEWLGNTTGGSAPLGPTNDAQQMTNVIAVMNTLQSDVFCIEEVCDHNQFIARVGTDMSGYAVKCQTAYYSHFFDTPETPGNSTTYSQKVCFVYKSAIVSPVNAEIKSLLSNVYTYPPGNNWASGRLPYMFVANVTLNNVTKKMNFVGIHAKSGADVTSYNRRKQDVIDLKNELDTNYPNANVVLLGDYNDDLDASINVGQPSTYANFVADNVNYVQISKTLSDCGVSSTAKYPDIIDHFTASNEFGVLPVNGTTPPVPSSGIYYLENTVNVARPITYITSYTTSTSDHYPVSARFSFGIPVTTAPATITSISSGNWSSTTTWDCGCVPTSASNVIINTGNIVSVNVSAQAKTLNVKGTLNYITAFTLSLGM